MAATALAILGWPLQVAALALAPLTVVQPTLAIGLVLLLAMGSRMYGETVTRRDVVAVTAIVTGVIGLALCAPPTGGHHAAPIVIGLVLAALTLVAAAPPLLHRAQNGPLMLLGAGCAFTVTAIASDLLAGDLKDGRWIAVLGWAALCGLVAAVGTLDEMGALQRMAVARVAVPVFAVQTALPVVLAPLLLNERWAQTPGGGLGIVASLVACTAGAAVLGSSPAVDAVFGGAHAEGEGEATATAG